MSEQNKLILELVYNSKNGSISKENIFKKRFPKEYEELCSMIFPEDFIFMQKLWHYLHDDYDLRLGFCPVCGKRSSFISAKAGYHVHCSVTCGDLDKEVQAKKKNRCLEKHGNPNYNNREKAKKTCIEKYGVENPGMAEPVKRKSMQTKSQRYENPFYTNREKCWKTVEDKYGVKNISQLEFVKEKKKQTNLDRYGVEYNLQAKSVQIKSKKTLVDRYGADNYSKSKERAIRDSERFKEVHELYISRGIEKPNGISKIEILFYDYLTGKYGSNDIEIQYMSEKYPYKCDFYIKSLDVYVELNAHWTHGGHAFDKNDKNDIEKAKFWKSKDSKFYDIALMVWTVKDVEKRNLAKEKKLNYIELFCSDLENCVLEFEKQIVSYDKKK